jgi:hypothetical protein
VLKYGTEDDDTDFSAPYRRLEGQAPSAFPQINGFLVFFNAVLSFIGLEF